MNGEDLFQGFGEIDPGFLDDMQRLRLERAAGQPLRKGWSKMRKTVLGIAAGTAAAAAFTAFILGSRFTGKDPTTLPPEATSESYTEEGSTEAVTEPDEGSSAEETGAFAEEESPEVAGTGDIDSQPARVILAETSRNDLVTLDFSGNILTTLHGNSLAEPLDSLYHDAILVEEGVPVPVLGDVQAKGLYDPFSGEWVFEPVERPLYRLSPWLLTNSQAYLTNGILMDNQGMQIPDSGTAVFSRVGDYVSNGVQLFDLEGHEVCAFPGQISQLCENLPLPDGAVKTCAVISREDETTSLIALDGQEIFRETLGLAFGGIAGSLASWSDESGHSVITDLSLQPVLTEADFYARNPDYVRPITAGNGLFVKAVSDDGQRLLVAISSSAYCVCDRDFHIIEENISYDPTLGTAAFADESWLISQSHNGNQDHWYTRRVDGQLWAVCFKTGESICLGDYSAGDNPASALLGIHELFSRDGQSVFLYTISTDASETAYMIRFADGTTIELPEYTSIGQFDVLSSGIVRVRGEIVQTDENGNLSSFNHLTTYYSPEGELLASDSSQMGGNNYIYPDEDNLLLVTPEIECREIGGEIVVK